MRIHCNELKKYIVDTTISIYIVEYGSSGISNDDVELFIEDHNGYKIFITDIKNQEKKMFFINRDGFVLTPLFLELLFSNNINQIQLALNLLKNYGNL